MENNFKLPLASKGERPYFLKDKDVEKTMNMVMALAGELSVVYTRLRALESLLEKQGILSSKAVDNYETSDQDAAALDLWRSNFLRILLRPIYAEAEREANATAKENYQDAIKIAEE